ncbi:MAG: hypothetical protein ABJC33_07380 [Betaproteobacteria bacterium]
MAGSTVAVRLWVAGFIAGAIGYLIGFEPMLALLNKMHLTSATLYSLRPTPPLQVPELVSTAFWSGLWGIALALAQRRFPRGAGYWLLAFVFGALLPSLVAWFVVAPIKTGGMPHFTFGRVLIAVLLNGAWGLATAVVLRAVVQGKARSRD